MPLIALVFLMLAHELGHVLMAGAFGFPVRQLRIGFGPVLWRPTVHGIRLLVCLVPLCLKVGILQPAGATAAQQRLIAAAGMAMGLGLAFVLSIAPVDRLALTIVALADLLPIRGTDGWRLLH